MGTTQGLKLELIEWLASLQDQSIIRELAKWKEEHERVSLEQYNLEIDQANEEIERGNFLTHEEALKEIRSWRED